METGRRSENLPLYASTHRAISSVKCRNALTRPTEAANTKRK